jgi:trimethylamine corrinoid protein
MVEADQESGPTEGGIFKELKEAILSYDPDVAVEMATKALETGVHPLEAIEKGLNKGLDIVGDLFARFEIFLPELVLAGEAMKAALAVLKPALEELKSEVPVLGKCVIGTVQGDIHDIGKNVVGTMLSVNGFEVYDIGVDVKPKDFVQKTVEVGADIVGLSALMTTTAPGQEDVVRALEEAGLRQKVKVMIGGAATTEEWAREIGADGWALDAGNAVRQAKELATKGETRWRLQS